MSHCYSIGVNVDGKDQEVCSIVPGNEELAAKVKAAEKVGGPKPEVSPEEVQRAVQYHFKRHKPDEHPKGTDDNLVDQLNESFGP